jgi:uncharacterized membrane protein
MQDTPVSVIVAAYNDETGASKALKELQQAKKERMIGIKDAAVLRRDENNKLHISETTDEVGPGRGAIVGGVGGAVLGVIAGPVGWAALGGVAIGALAGKLHERGFPSARLQQIGESVRPDTSALLAVIEDKWVNEVETMVRAEAANVVTEAVSADIAQQLDDQAREEQRAA